MESYNWQGLSEERTITIAAQSSTYNDFIGLAEFCIILHCALFRFRILLQGSALTMQETFVPRWPRYHDHPHRQYLNHVMDPDTDRGCAHKGQQHKLEGRVLLFSSHTKSALQIHHCLAIQHLWTCGVQNQHLHLN